jgi:Immunity protein 10
MQAKAAARRGLIQVILFMKDISPVGFFATDVSVSAENDVLITAFGAPSTEDDDFYLMLQHNLISNEEDEKFGMDQPYIEYCGQGWSWYGHIMSFRLSRDNVTIQMDKDAATHMGNNGLIRVDFSIDDNDFITLSAALKTTFDGYSDYVAED